MKLLSKITTVSLYLPLCLTACFHSSPLQKELTEKFSPSHLNTFLGKPYQDLIKVFGVPTRKLVSGNQTLLVFYSNKNIIFQGQTGAWSNWGYNPNLYGDDNRIGYEEPGLSGVDGYRTVAKTCQVTFTLVDNAAIHWTRQGNTSWCGSNGSSINQ